MTRRNPCTQLSQTEEQVDEEFLNSLARFEENERGPAVKQQWADVANAME
jgi:hypothetical protein